MTGPNRPTAPIARAALPDPAGGFAGGPGRGGDLAPLFVAGGGIAGLAAAVAIARSGRKVTVLERAAAPQELGAGLQLGPNAVRALARLGLSRVTRDGLAPHRLVMREAASGRQIAEMPLGSAIAERHGAPYLVMPRVALHRELVTEATRLGILIRFGAEVTSARPAAGGIEIGIAGARTVRAAGLIGADGLWSRLRRLVAPDAEPRFSGQVAWRATIPPGQDPAGPGALEVTVWLARRLHAVDYPIDAAGTRNLVLVTEGTWRGEGWDAASQAADMRRALPRSLARDLATPLARILGSADAWRRWPLFDMAPVPMPALGPLALIGDAAHPMLPFLAQAAAMGIEDAEVIAATLATEPYDMVGAFGRYGAERHARTERVAATARRNGRVFHLAWPASAARDAVMARLSGERLLARYDWLYGGPHHGR